MVHWLIKHYLSLFGLVWAGAGTNRKYLNLVTVLILQLDLVIHF